MKKIIILIVIFTANPQLFSQSTFRMPSIFSDNMVLQQNTNTPFWGVYVPGSNINIKTSWGLSVNTIVAEDSSWSVKVKIPAAGGPYKITVKSDSCKIIFNNVLIGEVWLCSGQSNMALPLSGDLPDAPVLNSEEEINNADYPKIRLFTVLKIASLFEKNNCIGNWEVCSPNTVSDFSAVAYFFGKKLHKDLNIPIGLINASWGGTPAEAWTSKKYLSQLNEFNETLNSIDLSKPAQTKLATWLQNFKVIKVENEKRNDLWNSLELNDEHLSRSAFDYNNWETMNLPANWEETKLGVFDGFIWFRKQINLPDDWVGKKLILELGAINDYDVTYVNGKKIGSTEAYHSWKKDRVYSITEKINDSKNIEIAVRVHDTGGTGGIYGGGYKMRIVLDETSEEISLSGDWKYLPIAELYEMKYFVFTDRTNEFSLRPKINFFYAQVTPTALYNGMIAPLIPFSIKGVIWYQGESNTTNTEQYERLFPTLINNWRSDWGENFPFYFVQIAPYYNYGENCNSAYLRDAQRKTLSLFNTGMAVSLDIGDIYNNHPANKTGIGERLALIALANQYDKKLVYSGPLYRSMQIEGNKIELTFEHVGSGLDLRENNVYNQFLIAGPDKIFVRAEVKISGNKLIVWAKEISVPLAVRYSWRNTSKATLFNKEGLPASSFRTDNW